MPTQAEQTRHFFMGLDNTKYREYKLFILNRTSPAGGGAAFPNSIQAVVDGATSFIPTAQSATAPTTMAYVVCYGCGKDGHRVAECPHAEEKYEKDGVTADEESVAKQNETKEKKRWKKASVQEEGRLQKYGCACGRCRSERHE